MIINNYNNYILNTINKPLEPSSYNKAINSKENLEQLESMKLEVDELYFHNTQTISYKPKENREILKGRQVYKIKENNLDYKYKYKSRQVIQGFKQVKRLNYKDTFITTTRIESIRILLILAIYNNYYI